MRRKLVIFNLIIILLVIITLTLVGNYVYRTSLMNSRLVYTTELQSQLANSFWLKIQSVENTLELLGKDEAVIKCLATDKDSEHIKKVNLEQGVRNLFYKYENIYPEYLNMILVYENGKEYISNDSYRLVNDSFYSEPWFKEAMNEGSGYSYHFYNAVRNLQSWKRYDYLTYISIARAVSVDGKRVGVIMIDVSLQDLRDMYKDLEPDTGSFFFLMNDKGQIVLSPVNPIVYRIKPEWFEEDDEGIIKANILDKRYNLVYNKFENRKMLVVGAYDVDKEGEVLIPILKISLIMAILAFAMATIWSVLFMSKLTKPLVRLSGLMQEASQGNLDVRFDEPCSGEIRSLGFAFNKMVVKIKSLLGMVYIEQKQKRDAELQVLQEQIKPHFLYNTLDMIGWMARKHSAKDILHVIELMSDFFRISLSKGKELISLVDELKMVSSYLDIQQMRYENMFVYKIDCPKELEDKPILRMCLQPLVENCLYHGIKESDNSSSLLKITVSSIENGISIRVEDDGKPISDEVMKRLNSRLATNNWEEWSGGFGVQNVGIRLWRTFAKGSGLRYTKDAYGFTVATLVIIYDNMK